MSRKTAAVLLARRPSSFVPEDLALGEIDLPEVTDGTALVRNLYMSLDPSTRGRMDPSEKQYTANFEIGGPLDGWAVGVVEESATDLLPVGTLVRHRQGWRERAVIAPEGNRVVDTSIAPITSWLSALGQTGFTAYVGMIPVGNLAAGDTVLVSGAGGGVGSIAGQIAKLRGAAKVIGSAGGAAKCEWLREELGYDATIDYRAGDFAGHLAAAAPDGVDLFFDNVGGDQLVAALHNMKIGGRISLCGMVSMFGDAPQPGLNQLIEAVLRRLTIRGFIVRDYEYLRGQFEAEVGGWITSGAMIDRATVVDGLENAGHALAGLLKGANSGKMLVRIGE